MSTNLQIIRHLIYYHIILQNIISYHIMLFCILSYYIMYNNIILYYFLLANGIFLSLYNNNSIFSLIFLMVASSSSSMASHLSRASIFALCQAWLKSPICCKAKSQHYLSPRSQLRTPYNR